MQTTPWILLGLICGLLFIGFTRKWGEEVQRRIFAVALVAAALIYVAFAAIGSASGWIAIELIGLLFFSAVAELGVKRSILWLALGWAAHPVWDAGLHLYGMGASVAPPLYVLMCIGFDTIIAGYIVMLRARL